jgi:hypothetical protein
LARDLGASAQTSGDIRGFPLDSGTLGDECLNGPVKRAAGDEADDRNRWRKRARVGRRTGLLLIVRSGRLGYPNGHACSTSGAGANWVGGDAWIGQADNAARCRASGVRRLR